jgi:hypothetical protein
MVATMTTGLARLLWILLPLSLAACGSSKKSFGELCQSSSECESNLCDFLGVYVAPAHKQCTAHCNADSDCGARGVCAANLCGLACGKDSDCPVGASCQGVYGCAQQ